MFLTPLLVAVALLAVACARVTDAHLRLVHAATVAARAASLTRDQGSARQAATAAAQQAALGAGPACQRLSTTVGTGDWAPGGTVRVHLRCTLGFADLALLQLPGSYGITATATSPIDRWRGRALGLANSEGHSAANLSTGGAE